jgi:hypothetical protein
VSVEAGNILTVKLHATNPRNVITGWLEPLLDRIARDNSTVVCPVIDGISDNTFEYTGGGSSFQVGGFNWGLQVWNFYISVLNFI